ncbi:MAG: Glu/Leu/Phe/Val dehydrogenase family protein, partial [Gemmatimonas sp.]
YRAIEASAFEKWGSDDLQGRTVAIQGCGNVGFHLALELHAQGAKLIVTDIDGERMERVVAATGATVVALNQIYGVQADIFAPCALGGIINDDTIPQLKVDIVSGAANNQLLESRHGDALEARGILYAPDYVANAGGVINVYSELTGWSRERALRKADEIYETVCSVFRFAKEAGMPTYMAADRVAEQRIAAVRGMMKTWPQYPIKEA